MVNNFLANTLSPSLASNPAYGENVALCRNTVQPSVMGVKMKSLMCKRHWLLCRVLRFEVVMVVTTKMTFFLNVTPCRLVARYRVLEDIRYLSRHDKSQRC